MTTMSVPPDEGKDFNGWLAWHVEYERESRRKYPNIGDPDAPRPLIEEAVMQEMIRDGLYNISPLMEFCMRKAVEHNPSLETDYIMVKAEGDASDEFWNAWTIEFTARINECLIQMRPKLPPTEQED